MEVVGMLVAVLLSAGMVLIAGGCTGAGTRAIDTSGTVTDGGTTDDECGDCDDAYCKAGCVWVAGQFSLDISNGDAAGYLLGLAEVGCEDDCWTGEDCGLGDGAGVCHPLDFAGGSLATVAAVEDLVPGETTLHHRDQTLAYYIFENASLDCWWWGAEYAPFMHCQEVEGLECPLC